MRICTVKISVITLIGLVAGCNGGGLTPNQKSEANRQWNEARANVLASLAADQLKDGSFDKCQESLDQALRLEPNNPKTHLLQAKLAIEQNKLDAAQVQLEQVCKLDPRDAEADYIMGVLMQRWNQLAKAQACYERAAEKDPGELSYPLAQAEMLVAQGESALALALLQSKARSFEHSAVIQDEIGQLLMQQRQYPAGIAALRQGCMLAGDDLTIREHLAFALLTNRQSQESVDCFEELLRDPSLQKRADMHAALAEALECDHRLSEARHHYQLATQLDSACVGYWIGLAKVLTQLDDDAGAESAVHHAMLIDPANGNAQYLLGYVRLKQSRLSDALAAFRAAGELNPRDGMSVCLEGYILCRMGRKAEGQSLYARAAELEPANQLITQFTSRTDN